MVPNLSPVGDNFLRGGEYAEQVLAERQAERARQRAERELDKKSLYVSGEGDASRASANPRHLGVRHVSSDRARTARGGQRESALRADLISWTMRGMYLYPFVEGEGRAASVEVLRQDMTDWAEQYNSSFWFGPLSPSTVDSIVEFCHRLVLKSKNWKAAPQFQRTPEEDEEFREKQRQRARHTRTVSPSSIAAARRNGSQNSLQTKAAGSQEVARLLDRAKAMESREERWAAAEKLALITGLTADHIFKRYLATPKSQTRTQQAERRSEVLSFVEAGNSQRAAGRHFGISEGAVRKHVKRARHDRQEQPMDTMDARRHEPVDAPQEAEQQVEVPVPAIERAVVAQAETSVGGPAYQKLLAWAVKAGQERRAEEQRKDEAGAPG